jgi:16S rRNA (cytidine1402-2'-O)-methyltransferase
MGGAFAAALSMGGGGNSGGVTRHWTSHPSTLCYNSAVGKLYLVSTPIGNLEDITHRALRTLGEVSLIAAEDTRRSGKLLAHYNISTPLISYHEFSSAERRSEILDALDRGEIALISDAGTPGLSDPGYELVLAALEAGHEVTPIPGPSAITAAIISSGLPADSFLFLGYLPRRSSKLQGWAREWRDEVRTMVVFEAPHRLRKSLSVLVKFFGSERPIAVCRELTKLHEEILRGTLGEIGKHYEEVEPRGEYTLVIGGKQERERWEETAVREAIIHSLGAGTRPSQIARDVASESGWPRQRVYKIVQEMK